MSAIPTTSEPSGGRLAPLLAWVGRLDHTTEAWLGGRRSGPADSSAHLLSAAADRSKLWVAVALLRTMSDRRSGTRAAVRALATVGAQSAAVEVVVKRIARRARPSNGVALKFRARRPPSTSFPSGHAASATAAAILLADGMPGWGAPLALLALAVAWSRLQTGLHHLSDVVGGIALGAAVAFAVRGALPLHRRRAGGVTGG